MTVFRVTCTERVSRICFNDHTNFGAADAAPFYCNSLAHNDLFHVMIVSDLRHHDVTFFSEKHFRRYPEALPVIEIIRNELSVRIGLKAVVLVGDLYETVFSAGLHLVLCELSFAAY